MMAINHTPDDRSTRLPAASFIDGVDLQISDLQRSLAYYTEVIGLRPIEIGVDTAALGVPGSAGVLVRLRAVPGTRPVHRRGAFGLFHFAILLPERAALGQFVSHLSPRAAPAGMADHSVSEAIYLTDPDGLGIEVYADRPRELWEFANEEVVMTTDPLDVEDLVMAGEGSAWDGMPAGTAMGHVHLHVGNLEAAAAFYKGALGFDITMSGYPGALFFSAGGYHHHLGTNVWAPGPAAATDQARLLEWSIVVPSPADARAAGERLLAAGYAAVPEGLDWRVTDPWDTPLRITPSRGS